MTTQKSLVPFEQTVGHLINIVHDGLEGGNATAAAIKAQFGPYCDCAMAAWIIDGIDNAETDPTVMNKLRELLAADPAAVIERVVRQSPPERLLRRFCQDGDLMGGYMGVAGTEILQTLQPTSDLCEVTNIPVKLIWGTRDFHLANFTEEERTSTNSLLYGSMPSTYPEWDAVKPSSGYSINWEYIDTNFRIETPNEDDYQHISVQAVVYTEDGSFVRTSFPTLDVATSANSGLVDFDASTRTGNLRFSTLSGFRPEFRRDWGSQNSPPLWDNDIWAVELQILYKGIKLGHITIMSYAPTSQTQGNGAYMYGVGFTIFSAMIYN